MEFSWNSEAFRSQQRDHEIDAKCDGDEKAELALDKGRLAYVHVIRGEAEVNGRRVSGGDALLMQAEPLVAVANGSNAELLVFDLPETSWEPN